MRAAVVMLFVCGCYAPELAPGAPCSASGQCPGGQICDLAASPPVCVDELAPPARCSRDADCASAVCSESIGQCFGEGVTLFVAPGGDGDDCNRRAPCATVSDALARLRPQHRAIRVADGDYGDAILIEAGPPLVISGEGNPGGGATIRFAGARSHTLEVRDRAVTVEGLDLLFGPSATVQAQDGAPLLLFRVAVRDGDNGGVESLDADVTLISCAVTGAAGDEAGVRTIGGDLIIRRSFIANNGGAGIRVTDGDYDITNSIIATNIGLGVDINASGFANRFELNTVVGNLGGALCLDSNIELVSSIFAGNGAAPQTSDACEVRHSLFSDVAPPGEGNLAGDPKLLGPEDAFHLGPDSPAIDRADPASDTVDDIDGDVRPRGAGPDIGADEAQ